MMSNVPLIAPLLALVTDFGNGSPYVAQMKGVIYGILPTANIVDVSHNVGAQNVHQAAWILSDVQQAFPRNTIFVVVVDPGVGSQRSIVALQTSTATFIGPDNGALSLVAAAESDSEIYRLDNRALWRDQRSATFHGRDIMAPVAAHLAAGTPLRDVGPRITQIKILDFPPPQSVGNAIVGRIEYSDSFGNLITNIAAADLDDGRASGWVVQCAPRHEIPLVNCYADRSPGDCVALIGSNGRLEIAIVCGDAQETLRTGIGDQVTCLPQGRGEGLGPNDETA